MTILQQVIILVGVTLFFLAAFFWFVSDTVDSEIQVLGIVSAEPTSFAYKITTESERQLFDIRTPDEYKSGHLPEATNIDFYNPLFARHLDTFDRSQPIAIYCRSGSRSSEAVKLMKQMGFTDVIELNGGVLAWQEKFNENICPHGHC